jgi:hypothetical protein
LNQNSLAGEVVDWIKADRPAAEPLIGPAEGRMTCPSYPGESDGTQFAIRSNDGTFQFLELGEVAVGQIPIHSVRTFGPCLTSRCYYWAGNCQLGVKISQASMKQGPTLSVNDVIDSCPIKGTCRWRAENGDFACQSCVHVNYEVKYG